MNSDSSAQHAAADDAGEAVPTLRRLLLGRRLANGEQNEHKIGVFEGVPGAGARRARLGGLRAGSGAHRADAARRGRARLHRADHRCRSSPCWRCSTSRIGRPSRAYPSGGGSYTVAKENLGTHGGPARRRGADGRLRAERRGRHLGRASARWSRPSPRCIRIRSALCLGVLALVTLVNLRGTRESGRRSRCRPTCSSPASLGVLAIGAVHAIAARGGHPQPVVAPPPLPRPRRRSALWLLLRAFASGCTAMTGVEAVSNGVSAFREPAVPHGPPHADRHRRRLSALLLAGIAVSGAGLRHRRDGPDPARLPERPVAARRRGGRARRRSTTSPWRACSPCWPVGQHQLRRLPAPVPRWSPRTASCRAPSRSPGRRLVYSVGIVYPGRHRGLLLVAFGGITDRLIPLFADRRVPRLHAVAGGHGGALAPAAIRQRRESRRSACTRAPHQLVGATTTPARWRSS